MAILRALIPLTPVKLGGPIIEVPIDTFDVLVVRGRVALVRFLTLPDAIVWFTTADVMHCPIQRDGISVKVVRLASPEVQTVYRHTPRLPGLRVISGRNGYLNYEFEIVLDPPRDASCVRAFIDGMAVGDSIYLPGPPGRVDQYLQARRTPEGIEICTAYHGSSGSWTKSTLEEAVRHLAPGAALLDGSHPQRTGRYDVPIGSPHAA